MNDNILYLVILLLVLAYSVGNILIDHIYGDKYYFTAYMFVRKEECVFGDVKIKITSREIGSKTLREALMKRHGIHKESNLTILFYKRISKREYES